MLNPKLSDGWWSASGMSVLCNQDSKSSLVLQAGSSDVLVSIFELVLSSNEKVSLSALDVVKKVYLKYRQKILSLVF